MKEPPTEFFPVTDPAPRQYPDLVALLRRVKTGSVQRVAETSVASICRWLLHDALRQDDFLLLLRDYLRQLLEAGFDIERVTVHVGTLHPQLLGFYWYFQRGDGIVDELKVHIDGYDAPRYRRSPLAGVIEHGRTFRADTADAALQARYPLLADLAAEGIREYCVLPLGTGKAYHNAITLGTVRESGFDASALADIVTTLELFALHVERQILRMVAENVLDTYIGPAAGRKVLSGSIRRGTGEPMVAVIWVSDLRGFSALTDRLPSTDVLAVLNAYFECLTASITRHGGEVLKFIGDGLLAVFPFQRDGGERAAAHAALSAARSALRALDEINRQPPPALADKIRGHPLRTGIALHHGEVLFGNVGGAERLDFTVIGRAVNEASRIEQLTKELGCPILVSEPVARLLDARLVHRGRHVLRGIAAPVAVYQADADGEPLAD